MFKGFQEKKKLKMEFTFGYLLINHFREIFIGKKKSIMF